MHFALLLSFLSFLGTWSFAQAQTSAQPKHLGNLFIFDPSLGACGFTNDSSQTVATVSGTVFGTFPGAGTNPNKNPICHHRLSITYDGTSLIAPIVDFFPDSSPGSQSNVGLSLPGFTKFAPESDGIVVNVTWTIV